MNQEQRQAMAQRVASLMDAQGLTNESLAYRSGLSVKTVSRILNARHESRIGTIEKLAGALGVSELDIRGEPVGPLGLGSGAGQPSQLDRIEGKLDEVLVMLTQPSSDAAAAIVADVVARLEEAAESHHSQADGQPAKRRAVGRRKSA